MHSKKYTELHDQAKNGNYSTGSGGLEKGAKLMAANSKHTVVPPPKNYLQPSKSIGQLEYK